MTVSCPEGKVAVGYSGKSGAWFDHLHLICATLLEDGTLADDYTYTSVKQMRDKVKFSNDDWTWLLNQGYIETDNRDPAKAKWIQMIPIDIADDEDKS